MTPAATLKRVTAAATRAAAARARLEAELRSARLDGATLRELAAASGLSVETARKITMATGQ